MAWDNRTSGHVSSGRKRRILARDGAVCAACGDTAGPHEIDHINNRRGVGYNDDSNLQVLCVACHMAKTQRESVAARRARAERRRLPRSPHPGLMV